MLYHKQQASQLRRRQQTGIFPLAYVRSQYHAGNASLTLQVMIILFSASLQLSVAHCNKLAQAMNLPLVPTMTWLINSAGTCSSLAFINQLSSQHQNNTAGRDVWQQIKEQSQNQSQKHLMQQHCKRLQLASHACHMQYWNMQCTRRLLYAVQLPVGLQTVLVLKLWSPQTAAEMPRSDPF